MVQVCFWNSTEREGKMRSEDVISLCAEPEGSAGEGGEEAVRP